MVRELSEATSNQGFSAAGAVENFEACKRRLGSCLYLCSCGTTETTGDGETHRSGQEGESSEVSTVANPSSTISDANQDCLVIAVKNSAKLTEGKAKDELAKEIA